MIACLSLWATGFKLSALAYTFDNFFNIAVGGLQKAHTSTAYYSSSAHSTVSREEKLSNSPTIAQFLVLGIRNISTSTAHPQCTLSAASQTR
jgi:hypothetical protein